MRRRWISLAAGTAAVGIALVVLRSMAPADFASALRSGSFRQAAAILQADLARGDAAMLTSLGNLYYLGLGVEQDYVAAARYYSMAAFAGNVDAQINLGLQYNLGRGVPQDSRLAYAWFNFARGNGSEIAQVYMSEMLSDRKMTYQWVNSVRRDYATLDTFPRLH